MHLCESFVMDILTQEVHVHLKVTAKLNLKLS